MEGVFLRRLSTTLRSTLFIALCVFAGAAMMLGLLFAYRAEDNTVKTFPAAFAQQGNPEDIAYAIESLRYERGLLRVEGWCVLKGVTYDYYNYGNDENKSDVYNHTEIGFIQGDSIYLLPTKLSIRQDVSERIADGIDYRFCGFIALLPESQRSLYFEATPCLVLQDPAGTKTWYPIELPQGAE